MAVWAVTEPGVELHQALASAPLWMEALVVSRHPLRNRAFLAYGQGLHQFFNNKKKMLLQKTPPQKFFPGYRVSDFLEFVVVIVKDIREFLRLEISRQDRNKVSSVNPCLPASVRIGYASGLKPAREHPTECPPNHREVCTPETM